LMESIAELFSAGDFFDPFTDETREGVLENETREGAIADETRVNENGTNDLAVLMDSLVGSNDRNDLSEKNDERGETTSGGSNSEAGVAVELRIKPYVDELAEPLLVNNQRELEPSSWQLRQCCATLFPCAAAAPNLSIDTGSESDGDSDHFGTDGTRGNSRSQRNRRKNQDSNGQELNQDNQDTLLDINGSSADSVEQEEDEVKAGRHKFTLSTSLKGRPRLALLVKMVVLVMCMSAVLIPTTQRLRAQPHSAQPAPVRPNVHNPTYSPVQAPTPAAPAVPTPAAPAVPTPHSTPTPPAPAPAKCDAHFKFNLTDLACTNLKNNPAGDASSKACEQQCCLTTGREPCAMWSYRAWGKDRCWLSTVRTSRCVHSPGWVGGSNVGTPPAPTPTPPAPTPTPPAPTPTPPAPTPTPPAPTPTPPAPTPTPPAPAPPRCPLRPGHRARVFKFNLTDLACANLKNNPAGDASSKACEQQCCLTTGREPCAMWSYCTRSHKDRCWLGTVRTLRCVPDTGSGWIGGSIMSVATPAPPTPPPTPTPPAPAPAKCDARFKFNLTDLACTNVKNNPAGDASSKACAQQCCLTTGREPCAMWSYRAWGKDRCWLGTVRTSRCVTADGWIGGSIMSVATPVPPTPPVE
jgi:hypothetical protein